MRTLSVLSALTALKFLLLHGGNVERGLSAHRPESRNAQVRIHIQLTPFVKAMTLLTFPDASADVGKARCKMSDLREER